MLSFLSLSFPTAAQFGIQTRFSKTTFIWIETFLFNSIHTLLPGLLSHEKFHEENLEIIKNLLVLNNYSIKLINKYINIRIFQIKNKNTILEFNPNNKQREIDYKCVVSTPYFGNLSFKIKRLLNAYNLTTVFRNTSKLDKYIKLGKDPLEKLENSNVIYNISYLDCSKTYVGQTGRMLFVRCEEHKKNINLNEK